MGIVRIFNKTRRLIVEGRGSKEEATSATPPHMPSTQVQLCFVPSMQTKKAALPLAVPLLHLGLHVDHHGTRYAFYPLDGAMLRRCRPPWRVPVQEKSMPSLIKAGIILGNVGVAPVPSATPDLSGRSVRPAE